MGLVAAVRNIGAAVVVKRNLYREEAISSSNALDHVLVAHLRLLLIVLKERY